MSPASSRSELRALAVALLVSLVVWNVPYGDYALYPFKLLATWLHEMSHGVVMMITGAGLDHVVIYRDTSGLAHPVYAVDRWGEMAIACAGYMGTPVWGALLLMCSRDARSARRALLVLASLLDATAIVLVSPTESGDVFGQWAVAAMGCVVAACAIALPARWRLLVAHFIAAQACVNALLDIRVLLRPSQVVGGVVAVVSDATNMAELTFDTDATWAAWTWALTWLVWSLAILFVALRVLTRSPAGIQSRAAAPP
jgi:hypothetical protein